MNSGKLLEMFRWNIILSHTISVCTAKYKSSPRHHISLCGIGDCFFCSLSGAIRFAVAKRRRRLRRRFSRGCATTNVIVLMTLLSKNILRKIFKQYHKYRRSPRVLPPQKPQLFYQSSHFCKLAPFFPFGAAAVISLGFSFVK